ncbi:2-aminoethylphosphonate aminotransferase [Paenibacillus hamazuiensis]|uniref:2-aminoethylphosphonate aminotransferase n=1 Tax=Paenibacillus hamazuiensis TaxID=2936508 RepID=UPI00200D9080|nr:2-aminoethylphosphonate--pyruvate transaminase [Paenibacillus hamazuiensis]
MEAVKRNILLTPGPATTTESVKRAQIVPDICPREAEFGSLLAYVSEQLTRLVADPNLYTTVLFGGSGTAAVEAMLSSAVGSEAAVIVNNGAYGQRMCDIAETYGIPFLEFVSPPAEAVDLAALESFIAGSPRKISHLAVVHHETTTGLLNDVASIGELCRNYRIELLVDAISSFAAVPVRMYDFNISYLAASSNKNIQGMPGIAFVIADKSRLESLRNNKPRSYYLNLFAQYDYFARTRQLRFTPPVQTFYALKQAIEELKTEGIEARYKRYSASWSVLIEGIARLGLKHLVDPRHHAKIVTAIMEPCASGYDFQEMHDFFYEKGFTIYPGKLDGMNTFRIANIGDITFKDIEAFLQLLGVYLGNIGYTKPKGGV